MEDLKENAGNAEVTETNKVTVKDSNETKVKEEISKEKPEETVNEKKYTEEDIKTIKKGLEKKLEEKTKAIKTKTEKMAGMTPEEQEEFKNNEKLLELEKREQENTLRELKLDTIEALVEKDLDKEFLDYVVGTDLDDTLKRIDSFKSLFDKKVQAQVEIRLKGKTPSAGNSASQGDNIREEFKKSLNY